jgi:hypothetical protein
MTQTKDLDEKSTCNLWVLATSLTSIRLGSFLGKRAEAMRHLLLTVFALTFPSSAIGEVAYEETPFRLGNLVYREAYATSHPVRSRYGDIPFEYPSAESCLFPRQNAEQEIDDEEMNWKALSSVQAVEVCLFRVASKLQTKERIAQWLIGQGWEQELQNEVNDLNHIYDVSGRTWQLLFSWNTESLGPSFGTEPLQFGLFRTELSATVEITLNEETGVLTVIYGSSTNWNK